MPDVGRVALLLVIFAAFVGLASARRTPGSPAPAELFAAADHPVAALAWAKSNCDTGLVLSPSAPRAHAEVVMRVAASFEQAKSWRTPDEVCREAIAAARPAIAPETLPKPGTPALTVAAKTAANEK